MGKHFENKPYPFYTKKRHKEMYYCSGNPIDDTENLMNFLNRQTNEKDSTAQYFYADASFIKQATFCEDNRLQGGGVGVGGCEEQEIFYDCQYEPEPHLQIYEMINEIKNPREFKSLLKQMAYTSSVLYRTFRQACRKTKNCKQIMKEINYGQKDCGDMNPLEIVNIEVPRNNRENLVEERYDSFRKVKREKKKKLTKEQSELMCPSCQHNEDRCEICKPEMSFSCQKSSQKSLTAKKLENFEEVNKIQEIPENFTKQECDFSNWFPENPGCLEETQVCQQYDEELKHLDFCERCAVLRGEQPLTSKMPTDAVPQVNEKSSQTCQQAKSCKAETCSKSAKPLRQDQQKHVLNLNPVCVTIPLKLQVDAQNCQTRFIETEIVMEAFSGEQNKSKTSVNKPQKPTLPIHTNLPIITNTNTGIPSTSPVIISNKILEQNGSDLFYSCISTSGIIKPKETPAAGGESSLNEVLDIIKKRTTNSEEKTPPLTEKRSHTQGTQMTQPESVTATTMTVPRDPNSRTDFTQTEQIPQAPAPAAPLPDSKLKAQQLRAELLKEVTTALEQTTPVAALKALMEGKRFSLPNDLRPKETSNIKAPIRHSFPSNYQTLTTNFTPKPLQPLQHFIEPNKTPAFPPKPSVPKKPTSFITETVQTDASAITASGHYKRNEMRHEIQEELKDLLKPNDPKSNTKYKPEERDEILLDLYKLFHPETAGRLPKQISRENALQDISYLVQPETALADANFPKTSDSQESIIQSIRHILNPKTQQKSKKKKYDKEMKEKILEDLQIILRPRQKKPEINQEVRASVLHDLRFMLETGIESTSPHRPPRISQLQANASADTGPSSSSRAQEIRQQRQQKPPNEIRDSLMTDLKYLLDSTQPQQSTQGNILKENIDSTRPAVRKPSVSMKLQKSNSIISSEASLPDHDKSRDKQKILEPSKPDTERILSSNRSNNVNIPTTKSSSSDTFFLEMQDQNQRSTQQKNK